MNQLISQDNNRIKIHSFILVQTGTYQEQMVRPFVTNVQHTHLAALEQLTQGGRQLGVGSIEQVASDMLKPDTQPEGIATIREGWSSRRFRFIMRVDEEHVFNPGENTQRLLYGYTDHCDSSVHHLDPNMRIYFNSETVVRTCMRNTPNGIVVEPRIMGSNQIISPLDMEKKNTSLFTSPVVFTIRPQDVFHRGQTNHMREKLAYSGAINNNTALQFDLRSMSGGHSGYQYSRRRDTTPSRYLSDTMRAYKHAMAEASMIGNDQSYDREVLFGEAESFVVNQNLGANSFFGLLKNHAGYTEQGFITYRDLCSIFPEAGHSSVTQFSMDNGRSIRQVSMVDHSEYWAGSDNMTVAASMIAQVVPAIMMDNFIRSMSFSATNSLGGHGFVIDVHNNIRSVIDHLNLIPFIEEVTRRVELDILRPITQNGNLNIQLSVSCDLAGESIIDITLDAEPHRRYIAPTFSDSLFTPVVTHDHTRQGTIADDILFVLESTIQPANAPKTIVNQQPTDNYNHPIQTQQGVNSGIYSELL